MAPALSIRFAANLAELRANLAEGKNQIEVVATAMGKLSQSLSGDKIIRDANNIVAAVNAIGGAARLTSAEQVKLNATLDDAIQKYQLMGKQAPAAMIALRDATAQAQEKTSVLDETIGQLAASFAIGNLIAHATEGLLEFAKSIPETASQLADLSERTGVSIEYLQGLKVAADTSGSSVEEFAQAIFKMGVNVQEGNQKTKDGLADLAKASGDMSLAWKNIKTLAPEEQFKLVTTALSAMDDQQRANAIGVEIFGKQFQNMAAAVHDGSLALAKDTDSASAAQVRAFKAAEDALIRFKDTSESVLMAAGGNVILALSNSAARAQMLLAILGGDLASVGSIAAIGGAAVGAASGTKPLHDIHLGADGNEASDYIAQLMAAQTAMQGLSQATLNQIAAGLKIGTSAKELNDTYGLLPGELELIKKGFQDQATEAQKDAAEQTKYADDVQKAMDAAFGMDQERKLSVLSDAVERMGGATNMSGTAVDYFAAQIRQANKDGGELDQTLQKVIARHNQFVITLPSPGGGSGVSIDGVNTGAAPSVNADELNMLKLPQQTGGPFGGLSIDGVAPGEVVKNLGKQTDLADHSMKNWADSTKLVVGGLQELSQIPLGKTASEIESIASDAATAVGDFAKGNWVGGTLAAIHGIGSAIADVFHIGQTAGRDLVSTFAQQQGGYDQLHAKLLTLGDAGETLWKNLTQGVGSNNPTQAKAAIDAVNAALEKQTADQAALAQQLQDQQGAYSDLQNDIQKYHVSITQLGPAWKQNNLTAEATDLISSYTRLVSAGVSVADTVTDMSGVIKDADGNITGFSGGLDQMFNDAIATGAALPDQFEPIAQKMIDLGLLVDGNGDKIKDLSGIKFSKSLDDQFGTLIDKISTLITLITNGLNPAIAGIGNVPIGSSGSGSSGGNSAPNASDGTKPTGPSSGPSGPSAPPAPGDPGSTAGDSDLLHVGGRAAGGIYATGAAGVATWFGEAGAPELGGPVSFMSAVLANAMRQSGASALGGGDTFNVVINAKTNDPKEHARMFIQEVQYNRGGARTRMRDALGV